MTTSDWKVVLVRHGEATSTSENPARPLTIEGRQHAERVASWLKTRDIVLDEIVHSSKLRARQTAKIFGNRLGVPPARVHETAGLEPNDDPQPMADRLESERASVMVVGHLPYLNRLVSTLLVGGAASLQFRFIDAGAVVLAQGRGGWQVEAVIGHDCV
ncbi:MAG: phosphohistidine phosphatase SixA [Holophagae bacterium]|jgi:phosphohistidine phosphatase